jgi:hypothetical protein
LLSHNVRYFLGLDNSVNSAIRDTIISGRAERFWSLNNGITIVCDQIIGMRNGFHALNLKNTKIVNGGQTACVVFDALKMLGNDRGSVAIKIIETDEEKLIEEIAISTNSQSRIYGRDLRAFDIFQKKLAKNIEILGYFYKRKRSEKSERGARKTIDMARAGQILLAYVCGEPTLSKTATNEIFDGLYETAFDSSVVTGELIVAAFRCYERIEAKRQEALAWQKSATRNSFAETWIVEGHFHVLFVVGELLKRDRINLSNFEQAIDRIDKALAIVEAFVAIHKNVSAYRLFRLKNSRAELLVLIDKVEPGKKVFPVQLSLDI